MPFLLRKTSFSVLKTKLKRKPAWSKHVPNITSPLRQYKLQPLKYLNVKHALALAFFPQPSVSVFCIVQSLGCLMLPVTLIVHKREYQKQER